MGVSLDRRTLLAAGLALVPSTKLSAQTRFGSAAYDRAIVIDGLGNLDDPYAPPPAGRMAAGMAADLARSGATAFHFTVGGGGNEEDFRKTVDAITRYDDFIEANADRLLKVDTAADIQRAKREGRCGLIYGFQGAGVVGEDLDRIRLFRSLGVRIVQPTYNTRNLLGDGCLEPGNAGLSKLGRAFIAKLEEERVLLDLSHASARTIAEGIAASTRPPLITHTGCRALHDHPRNTWDSELRAMAQKGGVVGIYWIQFLSPINRLSADEVIRHMAHAVNICGEDHVAIGTDGMLGARTIDDAFRAFQLKMYHDRTASGIAAPGEAPGVFNVVPEWDGPARFRRLAEGLDQARWSTRRIEKVLGANLMRVYADGWAK